MRIRITLITLLVAVAVGIPIMSRAATNDVLLQQIADLLAQVQFLQGQLQAVEGGSVGPVTATPSTGVPTVTNSGRCLSLEQNLSRGDENAQVKKLQEFLAQDPSVYPEDITSGYYGGLTERAVQRWQARNGVVSTGSPATTGYGVVGPKTRQALTQGCTGAEFNEAIARDLVVTPEVGPLPLQATATFSLNSSSCSSFILDWGDGSAPLSFDAGNTQACTRDIAHKRATHTYRTPGTHRVTLRAGHSPLSQARLVSTKFVSVGDTAPTNFSLQPTSGSAPLTTSITFPVRGSNCTSYEADWGDGTVDRHEAPQSTGCLDDTGTQSLTHTYVSGGTYAVSLKTGKAPLSQLQINERWNVVVQDDINPSAAVEVQPTTGNAPLTVQVNMYGYGETCTSYSLDWGDGSSVQEYRATGTECAQEPFQKVFTHTYIAPGVFTIRSKVGSDAPLDELPLNTQAIVVNAQQQAVCQYGSTQVCGEVAFSCPAGYTCSQSFQTFQNRCALEAAGATFAYNGACSQ